MKATNCKLKTFFFGGGGRGNMAEQWSIQNPGPGMFTCSGTYDYSYLNKHEITTTLDYYSSSSLYFSLKH